MRAATAELIKRLEGKMPRTAIILGSGLGGLVDRLEDVTKIPYENLEGFPRSGVSGHEGELVIGNIENKTFIMLSGRAHYYEKGDAAAMRLPITVLERVGIKNLLLTNSAGSVQKTMSPGSVMLINDHINWSGMNPLIGEESDKRFVGMTSAYDPDLIKKMKSFAKNRKVSLKTGVYMWFSGPTFETPAEIKMAKKLGADAVGMSTVPEVILARFLGLNVMAFSVITNYGAGMTGAELSHDETKEMAPKGGKILGDLLAEFLNKEERL